MRFIVENLKRRPEEKESVLPALIAKETRLTPSEFSYRIVRRSIDSRKGGILFVYTAAIETEGYVTGRNVRPYKEPPKVTIPHFKPDYRPVVVGFGPAGIFCALTLARSGAKPIVLERGKDVDARAADVDALRSYGKFDPESNVCFGEGGAGTFSDGKLNSGVNDARTHFVLDEFVKHGAKNDILIDSLPHMGTDYLRRIVKEFRKEVIELGGDVLFESRFESLIIEKGAVAGVRYRDGLNNEKTLDTKAVFLALGHSSYDTICSLRASGVFIQPKDFSIGLRVEHPQKEIDEANYHGATSGIELPPSSYKSVAHLNNGRVAYSFCMCPGGYVINSSSDQETVVTNGMSDNARDAVNGNAAILINVRVDDYFKGDPLDGFVFRQSIEKAAFCKDNAYFAPVERLGDFLDGAEPSRLGSVTPSYRPGFYLRSLEGFLPAFAVSSLKEAFPLFAARQSFFNNKDAVLTGVETRSSSPVRIPRNPMGESNIKGVFPLGEGASYAGGITSASLDGLNVSLGFIGQGK